MFFPLKANVKYVTPGTGVVFGPRGIIHKAMLHTKYHGSRPNGFRQKDFFHVSPYLSLCKAYDPWGGVIYGPRGII